VQLKNIVEGPDSVRESRGVIDVCIAALQVVMQNA
jgi:hypothetical protein